MKILKKLFYILLALGILMLMCSCDKENTPDMAGKSHDDTDVEWVIFDPFSRFSGKWKDYSLLKEISLEIGIVPEIKIISEDFNSVLSKSLISEDYPDMMTFLLDDTNLLKALANLPHATYGADSPLYQSIDEEIRSLHLDTTGCLSYIPGGFCIDTAQTLIANEGIYVHSKAYSNYGCEIKSFEALTEFIRSYSANENIPEITDTVLLDEKGFNTIEHLFGLMPSNVMEFGGEEFSGSAYSPVLSLLKKFGNAGVSGNAISYSHDRTPLVFIGSSSAISSRHTTGIKTQYTQLDISGSQNGFLSGYSASGSFATLITDGKNRELSEKLIRYMISTEVSRKTMYGEENIDWVIDESNNRITLISDTVERMNQNDTRLLNGKGIAVFPYVSSCYAVYPSLYNSIVPIKDIFADIEKFLTDPTLEPGKTYREKQLALKDLYIFTLSRDS